MAVHLRSPDRTGGLHARTDLHLGKRNPVHGSIAENAGSICPSHEEPRGNLAIGLGPVVSNAIAGGLYRFFGFFRILANPEKHRIADELHSRHHGRAPVLAWV